MKVSPVIRIMTLFAIFLCSVKAVAQEGNLAHGTLNVASNVTKARVFVDSMLVGLTPLEHVPVSPGNHTICIIAGDDRSWIAHQVCQEVHVAAGEEIRLMLDVLRSIQVTSEPYGATIVYRDSVLGETPFIFTTHARHGMITISKVGYESLPLTFDSSSTLLHCSLVSRRGLGDDVATLYIHKEESRTVLPVIITASSAVVTGIAAAYFKIRADNLYHDYTSSRNPEQLDRIRQLDLASGLALGASQLSLMLLTYFLLSR